MQGTHIVALFGVRELITYENARRPKGAFLLCVDTLNAGPLCTNVQTHSQRPTAMTTESDLRQRIHNAFCDKGPLAASGRQSPRFWVPPTSEQQSHSSVSIADTVQLRDDAVVAATEEETWLTEPNPNLGGRSPQDLLTGDDHDREFLGNVIATIEQGAFT